jgi:hypothetical protein
MGKRRDPVLWWLLACLAVLGVFVAATLLVGLGDNSDGDAADEDESELAGDCPSEDTPPARALLRCLGPAVGYVETPLGSGSAILLADGMAVTNAHVVHPFAEVDLVLHDDERHEGVAVAGVDALSDVALLGPIDTELPGTSFTSNTGDLEQGVDVFLLGFPGESGRNPRPTISRGILSRLRHAREFDQTYLQTDAAIGGGQSGGALLDERGRVIGLSGLSFAERFALALSARDVEVALERIRSDDSPPYRPFPTEGRVTEGSFRLADRDTFQVLAFPAAPNERRIRVTLSPDVQPVIEVLSLFGDPLFVNQAMVDYASEFEVDTSELAVFVRELIAPGVFEFEIPGEASAMAFIGTRLADGADVAFRVNTPIAVIEDDDPREPIVAGDRLEGELDILDRTDDYVVHLDAGEAVDIFVGSPAGDMTFTVRAPGERLADAFFVDDGGGGLYDDDARDVFVADDAGDYTLHVATYDIDVTGYVLRVVPPGTGTATER